MIKAELRALYKNKRRTLSEDEVLSFSDAIFNRLELSFEFEKGMNLHVFLPIKKLKEVETTGFISYLWEKGVHVFVPRMYGDTLLSLPLQQDTPLEVNDWGISEPVISTEVTIEHPKFNYVICPLLYSDKMGNRVGYGKGFYDKLFSVINKDVVKIGVNFFNPNESIDDVDGLDVPLDYLVTPTEVLSFGFKSKFKK